MARSPAQELRGQTAVVTGSSSGIGRGIALELAAAGANVLVHARSRRELAEQVANLVRSEGVDAEVLLWDLASPANQDQCVEQAWSWRPIDIWINNAGADVLTGPSASLSFEQKLQRLWEVDVVATVRLSRHVGARMRQRRAGTIINMGWDQADTGMAGESGELFASVKGAVMAFSRSLAKSLAPEVRVNCIAPGWIRTAWGERASAKWQDRAKHESLRARWGTVEDVSRVCRFLASPAADFVNGQVIHVNGGME
jgi:3-oxoacyl-[acyl-carrier protein] reductase